MFKANVLNSLNEKLSKEITGSRAEDTETGERKIDWYLKKKESGVVFEQVFDTVDAQGNFSTIVEGIFVSLPAENLNVLGKSTDRRATSGLLGVPLKVRVGSVDEEKSKVVLVPPFGNVKENGEIDIRRSVINALRKSLAEGEQPKCYCRVVKVFDEKMFVDILDVGIKGMLYKGQWSQKYLHTLMGVVKEGDYVELIVKKENRREGQSSIWTCTRKPLDNSADNINWEGIDIGSNLVVECVDKPVGKSYWVGVTPRIPGMEIMGDYTSKFAPDQIITGIRYVCNISKIHKYKREKEPYTIGIVPFAVYKEDMPKAEAVRRLRTEKLARGIEDEDSES